MTGSTSSTAWTASRLLPRSVLCTVLHDVLSLGAAVLFLTLVALIACTIPALRATRVSPTEALRDT